MATCLRCNLGDLVWDKDWHEKTRKWRLYDKNQERPHQCEPKNEDDYWVCGTCGTRTDELICVKGHRGHYMRV